MTDCNEGVGRKGKGMLIDETKEKHGHRDSLNWYSSCSNHSSIGEENVGKLVPVKQKHVFQYSLDVE